MNELFERIAEAENISQDYDYKALQLPSSGELIQYSPRFLAYFYQSRLFIQNEQEEQSFVFPKDAFPVHVTEEYFSRSDRVVIRYENGKVVEKLIQLQDVAEEICTLGEFVFIAAGKFLHIYTQNKDRPLAIRQFDSQIIHFEYSNGCFTVVTKFIAVYEVDQILEQGSAFKYELPAFCGHCSFTTHYGLIASETEIFLFEDAKICDSFDMNCVITGLSSEYVLCKDVAFRLEVKDKRIRLKGYLECNSIFGEELLRFTNYWEVISEKM